MKKFTIFAVALFFALPAIAQAAPKGVTLTWTDSVNPTGTTYNVYRASGLCSATPPFSSIATGIAVKTYRDAAPGIGNFCYKVTAVNSGVESNGSNTVNPVVGPVDVNLSAVVQ